MIRIYGSTVLTKFLGGVSPKKNTRASCHFVMTKLVGDTSE